MKGMVRQAKSKSDVRTWKFVTTGHMRGGSYWESLKVLRDRPSFCVFQFRALADRMPANDCAIISQKLIAIIYEPDIKLLV